MRRARDASDMQSIATACTGPLPVEIDFDARVVSAPRYFTGAHSHTRHEAFAAKASDGSTIDVVSNIDLAPVVPVEPGDRIHVRGELVRTNDGLPLVHWTHHDPARQHVDGWIDLRGRRYA